MAYAFFDTSALVKRYYEEPGTASVDSVIEEEGTTTVITSLAVVEATSAFRKKYRMDELTEATMRELIGAFFDEALADYLILPMDDVAMERAFELVLEDDLRTLDAVQLSAALAFAESVSDLTFFCADHDLVAVAADHGLPTQNPEADG